MAIRPIANPLPGERVLAMSPQNAAEAAIFWRRRPNMFAGRALSAGALQQRQAWQAGHITQRGQHRVPGTVDGFEAVLRGNPGGTEFSTVQVWVSAGRGLAVSGEDVVLRQPLTTTLADVEVVAPPGFFADGSAVGAPTADGSLNPRVIGATLGTLVPAARATLPAVGVLVLQPALVDKSDFDPLDPCDRSDCGSSTTGDPAAFEDWRVVDAVRLLWYVWPGEWRALPPPGLAARNALAWTVFQAEAALPVDASTDAPASGVLPWEPWGVPVALVQLDLASAQPLWVDRASVVRRGGLARNARLQLSMSPRSGSGTGTGAQATTPAGPLLAANSRLPSLQQAQIEQFAEEVATLSGDGALAPEALAQAFASFLPPVGLLPRNCYEPAALRSAFFPSGFDIDAVAVPVEQIDIVVRANAALAPLNLLSAESVRVLVPVPLSSWEPRLLITNETPDPEFQRTLDRFLLTRARALGLRQGLRVNQSVLQRAISGTSSATDAWDNDQDAVDTETLSPWGPPPVGGGHRSGLAAGLHQHGFSAASPQFNAGATALFCWVYLDPDHPPRTLMLQWHVANGDSEHRAYWGDNDLTMGVDGTASRARMGDIPAAGMWVRLEVPTASVALQQAPLDGMSFALVDGRAAFGATGSGGGAGNGGTGADAERRWFSNQLPDGAGAAAQVTGDESWQWLSANDLWMPFEASSMVMFVTAAPPPGASDNVQLQAIADLSAHPALQMLSEPERQQLYLLGVAGFSAYLKSRTDRADDLVDYGFVKVQTDVYRVRQLMLGTTAASRLAVSPVLATIAQAETATASQEQISSFIADLKKKVVAAPSAALAAANPGSGPELTVRAAALASRQAAARSAMAATASTATTAAAQPDPILAQRAGILGTRVDSGVISIGGGIGARLGDGVIGSTLGSTSVGTPVSTFGSSLGSTSGTPISGTFGGNLGSTFGTTFGGTDATKVSLSTGLGDRIGTQVAVEDTRRLGDIGLIGRGKDFVVSPPSPSDVANADPLAGSSFIRTTTIAKRLEDPKSKEARDYATSSRYQAVLALVRLADTLTADDGGVIPGLFEGVQMHGLEGDTFLADLKPPTGGVAPLERPFTDFLHKRELLGALLKVPQRLAAGQLTGDPDEAAMFSDSTDLSDHVVALMRKVEGRVKLYRDAIFVSDGVAAQLRASLATVAGRLSIAAGDLAEARHDTRVARSLLAEETERLARVNAKRIRILAEEVKFLVFMRPREADSLLATPTHAVDPGLLEAPVPACLREHSDSPDEIADMLRVVREAPANWFVEAPRILRRLDRVEPLLRLVEVARTRAMAGLATPFVAQTAGIGRVSQAVMSVAMRQAQALAPRVSAAQTLDVAALSRATWQNQQLQAQQVVSFADLADGGHGRADVARSAATELENIRAIVVCLHAEFSVVPAARRLEWAETLSEFDAAPNLRNLASLPRWSELAFEDRQQMQSYVDWLFGQIEPNYPQAVALVNDVVRMCLLLASHAPVNRIIAGRLARPVSGVVPGMRIPLLALDPSRLRVGMQAVAYRGEQLIARAQVEDIGNGEVSARVVETLGDGVELGADVRVHFEDSAALSLNSASAARSLFGH